MIVEAIIANKDKIVKYGHELNNKLILFIYYLKLIITLSYTIKLFY